MPRFLDVGNWARVEHFRFFSDFQLPFFNVCVNVDVTDLLAATRQHEDVSFFVALHYVLARAANELDFMRYRIRDEDQVIVHDVVDVGSIVLREDESFAFCYMPYDPRFSDFASSAGESIERARRVDKVEPADWKDDIIHCTVLPWISFTSFAHARRLETQGSVPKIAAGKYFSDDGRYKMPLSVEVHHALMDGIHVGRYYDRVELLFGSASDWIRQ